MIPEDEWGMIFTRGLSSFGRVVGVFVDESSDDDVRLEGLRWVVSKRWIILMLGTCVLERVSLFKQPMVAAVLD